MNGLPISLLPSSIIDWIVATVLTTGYWLSIDYWKIIEKLLKIIEDYWKIGKPDWKIRKTTSRKRRINKTRLRLRSLDCIKTEAPWLSNWNTPTLLKIYYIKTLTVEAKLIPLHFASSFTYFSRAFHFMNCWTGNNVDPIVAFQMLHPVPQMAQMAYIPLVIPYLGILGISFFNRPNITHFPDLYDQLCSDYCLSECNQIYRLPWYSEFFIGNYIDILIKDAD